MTLQLLQEAQRHRATAAWVIFGKIQQKEDILHGTF